MYRAGGRASPQVTALDWLPTGTTEGQLFAVATSPVDTTLTPLHGRTTVRAPLCRFRIPAALSLLLRCTATQKLRIVTVGISGGRSLTGPLRDACRFPSTRWYPVPGATRTTLGFGICPSFKGPFSVAPCQPSLSVTIRHFCIAER
jgi:hypothetical protein